jgi:hypothetical protein
MKLQRRFAPTGGEFAPESVARFIGIRTAMERGLWVMGVFDTKI